MRRIFVVAVAAFLAVGAGEARAEVKSLEVGGFDLVQNVVVRGTPTQVYDMITGDLLPWWDHYFVEHP